MLAAVACSAGPGQAGRPARPAVRKSGSTASGVAAATAGTALTIIPAPYQLPAGLSREVALPHGQRVLIVGGLTAAGTTTAAVTLLNPVTGRTTAAGRLATAVHDAGGAWTGGRPEVFGGGSVASLATVQALDGGRTAATVGSLPGARSDLTAVSLDRTTYLVGGYDGTSYDGEVLATTNGIRFKGVAHLPVPVRYPAVVAEGGRIWVLGGQTPAGPTTDIQRVDVTTGQAAVVGHLPVATQAATAFTLGGLIYLAGGQVPGGAAGTLVTTGAVLAVDPAGSSVSHAGSLPVPVANAAAAAVGGTVYLIGGNDGQGPIPGVTLVRLVQLPAAAERTQTSSGPGDPPPQGASQNPGLVLPGTAGQGIILPANLPWLAPAHGKGHLAAGSNPAALPGDVLIADDANNRLLIVDPQGRIRWEFPRPGDLKKGQSFLLPDDAFFSPNGKYIIATEEEDSVISVISIAKDAIVYRYGTPGVPGALANHVSNPDDAMMLPDGKLIAADIKNCRLLVLSPPAHHPTRIIGHTGVCGHNPPQSFGSPNGAFPATNGHFIVTEINSDWATELGAGGHVYWATHPPGVAYPSDTNEIYPGRYLTADYSTAGQVVEFNSRGKLLWRFGGLNHPSLALPLPNGDILVNDDYNDRVIVIDPATHKIVWQYGHTGVPGTAPGYLNDPDGVDLTPPDSMLITHAATIGQP